MKQVAVIILCLLFLVGCGTGDSVPEVSKTSEATEVTENMTGANLEVTYSELPDVNSTITEIFMEIGYTVDHATEMQYILNTVGIDSIEIYFTTGEAETGLNAMSCYANGSTDDSSRFTITTDNGVVFYVGYLGEDLYDPEQGGFLKKYSEVHVPETEVDLDTFTTLQCMAEVEVKSCLSHPSSADFHTFSWRVGRSDDNYKIIGKVSAKNSFGVDSEMNFGVWFTRTNDSFSVIGVEIDGERVK